MVTDPPNVVVALTNAMRSVGAVAKSGKNSSQGYSFRGVDAVVKAVGPAFRDHGIVVSPVVEEAQYATGEYGRNKTPMRECTLRVRFEFYGPAGDSISAVVYAEANDSGDKATAKAHSVAYRTALLQVMCIPTDDPDPDSHSYERSARDIPASAPTRKAPRPAEQDSGASPTQPDTPRRLKAERVRQEIEETISKTRPDGPRIEDDAELPEGFCSACRLPFADIPLKKNTGTLGSRFIHKECPL